MMEIGLYKEACRNIAEVEVKIEWERQNKIVEIPNMKIYTLFGEQNNVQLL